MTEERWPRVKALFSGRCETAGRRRHDVKRLIGLLAEIESLLCRAKRQRSGRADDIYRWTSVFVPLGRQRS